MSGGHSKPPSSSKPAIKAQVPKAPPQSIVEHEPTFLDEEATPDTIRLLLNRLRKVGKLDCAIQEKFSMDWRAEKDIITDSLNTILKQPSWMPRVGELVLFVRDLDELEICLENASGEFKLYSEQNKIWSKHPRWEAGVVGQIPQSRLSVSDIVKDGQYESIVYSGFRIEPLPNPDGKDKSLSKQYKYLALRQLRPFAFHEDYLKGIPEARWHATVRNARTVMSTMSLVSRHHFRGTWPTARISARGVFLGSELLCCGDLVRLLPAASTEVVDSVLLIESVKLELSNLLDAGDENDDENYNSNAFVYGKAFTTDASKAYDNSQLRTPPILAGYNVDWHALHDHAKNYKVPFNQVASRLYEADAMLLWYPVADWEECVAGARHLSSGLSGIRSGRVFSSTNNKRVPTGKSWYWGDSRAEVLDIETLNSFQVSYHDDMRNDEQIEEWEGAIKVLEHKATAAEKAGFKLQARAKAGDGMSAPTITAQDVADAEMEEGLKPGALLHGSDANAQSRHDTTKSDMQMSDAGEGSSVSTRREEERDTIMVGDSQDELDIDNEPHTKDVMSAFGIGKTSPMEAPARTTTSSVSSGWPSSSMSVAAPVVTTSTSKRPRGRPSKSGSNGGSSLKRQLEIGDSSSGADDAHTALASFKKARTAEKASSASTERAANIKKKKQYDDESDEEEDEAQDAPGSALMAFKAPTSGSRAQFSGVVIDVD